LRKGDDSPDGWVEYAQGLLNRWLTDHKQSKLTVDGKFGPAMDKAVRAFQAASKTMVDGIIGNQTWSLLREGKKDSIGTDGQKPHSFEQKNAQGRFTMEGPDRGGYHRPEDMFFMWIVSTGEQPIDDYHVTVKVTLPDGKSHTHKTKIGPVRKKSDDGQGNFHRFEVKSFTKAFRLDENKAAPIDPPTCTVDAYLDKEIGGDRWSGPITEYK